jgi:hypothetical protein
MMRKIYIILFLLFALSFSSCKLFNLDVSFDGASIPNEANSFSVSYIANNANLVQPALSQKITDALKDKISSQTRLVLTEGEGDLHFEGEITSYTTRPDAIQGDQTAALNRLTITVNIRYFNKFEEDKNFESQFSRFRQYDSNLSLSQVELELIDEINEELVEDIFNKALVNW